MGFPIYHNKQHLSADDMSNLVFDIEQQQIKHTLDFHPGHQGSVLTTTYGTSAQIAFQNEPSQSLTIHISGGVSYSNESHRIDLKELVTGEVQTSINTTTVQTDFSIVNVYGVFTTETGFETNYFNGGSFDSESKIITLGTPLPSNPLTVYINYDKIVNYTITSPPTGSTGTDITRIDLIYLEYESQNTNPYSIDFITPNQVIYQEVVNTRKIDSFQIKTITGTQVVAPSAAEYPEIPSTDIVPIAYILLRNNTTAIYDIDTGNIGEGYIEDARNFL